MDPPQPPAKKGKKKKKKSAKPQQQDVNVPAMALGGLVEPSGAEKFGGLTFEAVVGANDQLQKWRPVDEEGRKKTLEVFRRHLEQVLQCSPDAEELIDKFGYTKEEMEMIIQEEERRQVEGREAARKMEEMEARLKENQRQREMQMVAQRQEREEKLRQRQLERERVRAEREEEFRQAAEKEKAAANAAEVAAQPPHAAEDTAGTEDGKGKKPPPPDPKERDEEQDPDNHLSIPEHLLSPDHGKASPPATPTPSRTKHWQPEQNQVSIDLGVIATEEGEEPDVQLTEPMLAQLQAMDRQMQLETLEIQRQLDTDAKALDEAREHFHNCEDSSEAIAAEFEERDNFKTELAQALVAIIAEKEAKLARRMVVMMEMVERGEPIKIPNEKQYNTAQELHTPPMMLPF